MVQTVNNAISDAMKLALRSALADAQAVESSTTELRSSIAAAQQLLEQTLTIGDQTKVDEMIAGLASAASDAVKVGLKAALNDAKKLAATPALTSAIAAGEALMGQTLTAEDQTRVAAAVETLNGAVSDAMKPELAAAAVDARTLPLTQELAAALENADALLNSTLTLADQNRVNGAILELKTAVSNAVKLELAAVTAEARRIAGFAGADAELNGAITAAEALLAQVLTTADRARVDAAAARLNAAIPQAIRNNLNAVLEDARALKSSGVSTDALEQAIAQAEALLNENLSAQDQSRIQSAVEKLNSAISDAVKLPLSNAAADANSLIASGVTSRSWQHLWRLPRLCWRKR